MNCSEAKGLSFPENYVSPTGSGSIDPYVVFKLASQGNPLARRTPAEKDGGVNPKWNYDMTVDVVDQHSLDVEVYHQSVTGADVLLGTSQISLLPVFKNSESDTWVTLKQKKASGGVAERGVFVRSEND